MTKDLENLNGKGPSFPNRQTMLSLEAFTSKAELFLSSITLIELQFPMSEYSFESMKGMVEIELDQIKSLTKK